MFDFTLFLLPGAFASGTGATLDILNCAANQARAMGCAVPRWRVCSLDTSIALSSGLTIDTTALSTRTRSDRSVWILPGLGLNDLESIKSRLSERDVVMAIALLKKHARNGGTIAASCSAVFLLCQAGLLTGKRVTTTWWLGGALKQMEPSCTVDIDQMVVADEGVITGGAAFAHVDLVLHLLRTRFSPSLAEAVSRTMVIDGRESQARYIVPTALAGGNELVGKVISRFEEGLPHAISIAQLAADLCMSPRTLSRHVKEATGRSVSALLQSARINRARLLLETTKMSVEQVASEVGYADTTALRRLMRKVTQATPRQFRRTVFTDSR